MILTPEDDFDSLVAGASGFLLKDAPIQQLVAGARVLSKLGLRDRVQAVVLAYEYGLVRPGE
jgi:hypothetical protein